MAALFTVAKIWKQPKRSSMDEWIKKNVIYRIILFSHKNNELLSFATLWMDLEGIMLNEIIRQRKTNTL